MDEDTAAALFDERMTRTPQALAIEVVAMRALLDALIGTIEVFRAGIKQHAIDEGTPTGLIRGAGGMAAIQMIDEWLMQSMANLNDVSTAGAAEPWE